MYKLALIMEKGKPDRIGLTKINNQITKNKMKIKEGWSIDITNKKATHYYRGGVSLCGKETQKFYMDNFDTNIDYTQILGSICSFCHRKLKKEFSIGGSK